MGQIDKQARFSLHALNRALERGVEITDLLLILEKAKGMKAVFSRLQPLLSSKEEQFKVGQTKYLASRSGIKATYYCNRNAFVVGLRPTETTPRVITTWAI